ncbi:hypothetical protein FHS15_001565 [Paenibacillus castaneae]|uniref:hypothetical protein n=1 Tax=Paenibacillus castaneae TaxID=474957 RepID=UPI000C9BAC25|nr:hypothetical protein [Paenibacillus castaneae]NIK76440.1 hypothetical protein [Paenibacillus castaneae]
MLARTLKEYHFKRTKPTFYTRIKTDRIDFLHLHKFTFGPKFRVHIGTRFLCDTFDAVALNGIDSDGFRSKYNFEYNEELASVKHCVDEMMYFITTEGFKWFEDWTRTTRLLNFNNSPIKYLNEKYMEFLENNTPKEVIVNSYKLVGIKNFS